MFYERLKLLAKEKKKSFNEIESELGYSKNSMYHYKKVKPSSDKSVSYTHLTLPTKA